MPKTPPKSEPGGANRGSDAFVKRFNAEHPELKEIASKPFLGTRQRIILKLFSQNRTGLLVLMNRVWQKIRH